MYSEIAPNPSVLFTPIQYRGMGGANLSDTVTLNGYPSIGWVTDYYNTWLAQNSQMIALNLNEASNTFHNSQTQAVGNMIQEGIGSIASLNPLNVIQSGIGMGFNIKNMETQEKNYEIQVQKQMAIKEQQQLIPNSSTLSSSNATILGYNLFNNNIFTRYNIKRQFAERIDKFFDMYGYAINTVDIPNWKNRPNWNYIKTSSANMHGLGGRQVPQEDMQELKDMFDNGLTIWHNPNTFLDYFENNR